MKKKMILAKKIMALVLAASMSFQICPVIASAEEEYEESYDEFTEDTELEDEAVETAEETDEETTEELVENNDKDDDFFDEGSDFEDADFFGDGSAEDEEGIDFEDLEFTDMEEEIAVNPVYANIVAESDLIQGEDDENILTAELLMASENGAALLGWDEAAKMLCNRMKQRSPEITVNLGMKTHLGIAGELLETALAHNGDASEGDYLKWSYLGYKASITKGTDTVKIIYTITYNTTLEQENAVTQRVNEILESLNLSGNEAEKAQAIYGYICENVAYNGDEDSLTHNSAYAALFSGRASSIGFASLSYKMMLSAGLDCRIVCGMSELGDTNWNLIRIGEQYYVIDAATDAGVSEGTYQSFLRGTQDTSHSPVADYEYEVSESDYDFSQRGVEPGDEPDEEIIVHIHTRGTPVIENEREATCRRNGQYDEVTYCSECGELLERVTKYTAKGNHVPGESFAEGGVEPSCERPGYYYECVLCEVCGAELSYTEIPLEAKHIPSEPMEIYRVEATCENPGYIMEETYCLACGMSLSQNEIILEKTEEHTAGEPVYENRVEATCAEQGSYDSVVYCTVCGTEISRSKCSIPKLTQHLSTYSTNEVVKPAAFEEDGEIVYQKHCMVCGETEELRRENIPALASIKMVKTKVEYTGECMIPEIIIKDRLGNDVDEEAYYFEYFNRGKTVDKNEICAAGTYKVYVRAANDKYQLNQYVGDFIIAKKEVKITGQKSYRMTMGEGPIFLKVETDADVAIDYQIQQYTHVLTKTTIPKVIIVNTPGSAKIEVTTEETDMYKSAKLIVDVDIKPKKAQITSFTRTSTTGEVKWNYLKGITGYEVQYADNATFKNAKTVNVFGYNTSKLQLNSLNKSKKYYVRIRSYFRCDFYTTVYSDWSKPVIK